MGVVLGVAILVVVLIDVFNLKLGEALRDMGIEMAASKPQAVMNLMLGRALCRNAAIRRYDRTATADDAARGFIKYGFDANLLGNAAGSLFSGGQWEFTGQWKKSNRVTNHAHQNRVWRLMTERGSTDQCTTVRAARTHGGL